MAGTKRLIVIGGPTASGKTALAIALAQHFNTQIISADSRQFYQEMSIGTAKPTAEELGAAKHHFIGHLSIEDHYSAGQFEKEALAMVQNIFKTEDWAILVGGSGLFIKAITEGFDDFPAVPEEIRQALNASLEKNGLAYLQEELAAADPVYYAQSDHHNPRRLIRALEVIKHTGKPISAFRVGQPKDRDFEFIFLQPHWPRKELYARIDKRVAIMLAEGLEAEAKALYPFKALQSLQTVGYQELFDHFENKISLAEAVALIQQNSRRYAKRQLTWARQTGQWFLLKKPFLANALDFIEAELNGWQWEIEHQLVPTQRTLVAEEKITKVSRTKNGIANYFILAKQPRFSQAVLQISSDCPEEQKQILLDQLFLRAEGFPLYFWSNTPIITTEYSIESIDPQGNFPFTDWLEPSVDFYKYKKKA